MEKKKRSEKTPKRRLIVTPSQLRQGIALVPGCKICLVVKKQRFVFSG